MRFVLIGLGIILAILSIWYFMSIVAYILISAVLALIGRPIVDLMGRIHLGKFKIPKTLRAFFTLLLFWFLLAMFFRIFIPLLAGEVNNLSTLDPQQLLKSLEVPIQSLENLIDKYNLGGQEHFSVEKFLTEKAISIFNLSFLSSIVASFASLIGNIFVATFSVSFITFFFLRDERLFTEGILAVVPDKHVDAFKHAMSSTRHLLIRYFVGLLGQLTGIFIMVATGMTIAGVGFSHSVLIALQATFFNIIPYIGPLIGSSVGILLGVATHLDLDFYTQLLPLTGWMTLVFIITHLIDNLVSQPLIFSNSVNAHPLEIFILLLIAGSLSGITGMILAIPAYTVIRVFAKEFFNKFKVVKKLTKNID
jgi:predicted PurR-regulated permease PerM